MNYICYPLVPQRVAQKVNLSFLLRFKSNKLCYKVSLCENFQRQSCSRTISLSKGVYMLAINVIAELNN